MWKMTYSFQSTGKPVALLLHGFLGSKSQWNSVVSGLESNYDMLMVELPGHGKSPSVSDYSIEELSFEISQYLKQYFIEKVHFVGHSMGGYVGAAFAKAYPQHLHSLTMVNSIANSDLPARKQMRNRAIELIDRFQNAYVSMAINNLFTREEHELYKEIIEEMKAMGKSMTLESVLAALRAMRDRPSQLLDKDLNIQYIYGNRDAVIDKSLIEKELSAFNFNGVELAGGHMLLLTHPSELIQNMHFIE
ncbi:MAG: alpha/beta fold hydrolase [Nonlabens sp.]|uniref:alpha/beta fold hydrolase n=1 Tax=Nonlabens sp. TaxID=1888209 RepID=UPI003EF1A4D9